MARCQPLIQAETLRARPKVLLLLQEATCQMHGFIWLARSTKLRHPADQGLLWCSVIRWLLCLAINGRHSGITLHDFEHQNTGRPNVRRVPIWLFAKDFRRCITERGSMRRQRYRMLRSWRAQCRRGAEISELQCQERRAVTQYTARGLQVSVQDVVGMNAT